MKHRKSRNHKIKGGRKNQPFQFKKKARLQQLMNRIFIKFKNLQQAKVPVPVGVGLWVSASASGDQNEPVSLKENKSNLSLSDSTTDGESVNNIEHVNELDESLKEFEAEISTLKRSIYLKTVEKLIFQSAQTSLTNGASRKFEEIVKKLSYEQNMLSICISQQEELQKLKQQLDGQHLKHEEKVLAQYAETQQLQLEHQHQDVKHAFCQEQSSVQEAAVRQIGIEDKTQPGASNENYESTNKEKTNSKSVLLQISFRKNSIEHKPIVLEPSICKKVEVKAALQCKTVMLQPMLIKPTPVKRKFYPDFNTDQSLSKIQRLETGNRCNVSLEPINRSRDDLFNRPLRPRITYRKLQSNKIIRFVEVPMELTTKPNFFPPVGPYKCEGCGKFVRTNAEFVEHVKKIHAKDLDEEVVAIMDRHLLASSA